MKKVLLGFVFLSFLAACTSEGEGDQPTTIMVNTSAFARADLLANWTDNIIIPSYESFSVAVQTLSEASIAFKADRNEANLTTLRSAWLAAYKSWQHVALFEVGPAEIKGLRLSVNSFPANVEKIISNSTSGDYDLNLSSNRSAKGFPALDYLLYGVAETDAEIVTFYAGTEGVIYTNYIEAIVSDIATLSNQVLADWKQGYNVTFKNNDGASATASVDRFVNDYIFYYEKFLRAGKLGIPLGVFSNTTLSGNVEAYYEGTVSNELFLEGLIAMQDFFNGVHFNSTEKGESLASYLDTLNEVKEGDDLAKIINNQFNTARTSVTALNAFRNEIENNAIPSNMLAAYDEVQRIVPLLKIDMVSAMSISIDFVDADGD